MNELVSGLEELPALARKLLLFAGVHRVFVFYGVLMLRFRVPRFLSLTSMNIRMVWYIILIFTDLKIKVRLLTWDTKSISIRESIV